MKKIIVTLGLITTVFFNAYSQDNSATESNFPYQLRLNIINPGIICELPINEKNAFTLNLGIGYCESFPELKTEGNGWLYAIMPFADIQYHYYYKKNKKKHATNNPYLGVRLLTRGKEVASNFERTSDIDLSYSLIWGLKKTYRNVVLEFNLGASYYTDLKNNEGISPSAEISFGYILNTQ